MRTTEAERLEYVEAFYRSGLTAVAFCSDHGLNPKTFYAWRKRYPSNDFIKADFTDEFTFLPLQLKEDETPGDVLPKQPIQLSFKTQTFCLEVALDTQQNAADFKRIVQTLHELL
jgi:hypothetical protein